MLKRPHLTAFGTGILVLATVGMAVVLIPFWKAIFWAVVLAILCWPLRQALVHKLGGGRSVASLLVVLLILVFILIPALLVAGLIVDGAIRVIAKVQSGALPPKEVLEALPTHFPWLTDLLSKVQLDIESVKAMLGQGILSGTQFALTKIASVGQGASLLFLQAFVAIVILFALLHNGDKIYQACFDTIPLPAENKERFFQAFSEMAVATIKGMVFVGIVQGTLGGLIFWYVGIESAVFWGALMALLSALPLMGAGLVWAPAGIVLVLNGDVFNGLLLLAFGAAVISTADNVVRPIVVEVSSSLPGYVALVTTLGGLVTFGLTGLVLGPVIASLFLSAWQLFDEVERQTLKPESEQLDRSDSIR